MSQLKKLIHGVHSRSLWRVPRINLGAEMIGC